ncbi:beta-ketoacyl synthase chain length factor [Mucilaginibacter koreensis]
MKIYIRSAACISPQSTFNQQSLLPEPLSTVTNRLKVIEPDYKAYIDAKLIRRMSRIIRMGVSTALQCLRDAQLDMPDAIVTGTAYGCLEDTGIFLTRIEEQQEEMLSPTAFIQSTHNTVGAQIALTLQCHNYNNTFTQQGHSFESALLDAILLLKEGEINNALVGSADELTDISFDILSRFGLYRRQPIDNLSLIQHSGQGTIAGEGTAFFTLTHQATEENAAELQGLDTFYTQAKPEDIAAHIQAFLTKQEVDLNDIDLVLLGNNGDIQNDEVYPHLQQTLFNNTSVAGYKHLCGEYPTAISFALWLGSCVIKYGQVPDVLVVQPPLPSPPKSVLIYNHYQHQYHTLILLGKC